MRRLSASTMALAGFVVALLAGMQAENPTGRVIFTAIVALVICHVTGTLLGMVIESVLSEHRRNVSNEMREGEASGDPHIIEGVEVAEAIEVEPVKNAA
ncbi:MAG: hypothetical protein Phyf2KO_10090 [Phycisphaerales bacterium]